MEHDAILELNGTEIMRGDRLTIDMIFNNLNGRNFAERREWENPGTLSDYLAYMAKQLHVGHWAGIMTVRINGVLESEFHFPENALLQPQADTTATEGDAG